ncbi:hypothetical protein KA068_00505 [Candidatus Saccharibacteria bacterium]|jgi:hypothetical protein|nr:hypothetical protein [Candidatus Saccharibacteria bacterium]
MSSKSTVSGSKINIVMAIIVVILLLISGYLYKELRNNKNGSSSNNVTAQKEAEDLKAKVGKIILLPDETPVIGTVNDKDKFKDQPFFNGVENGDKILIFSESKKAVIYRDKDNRVINSGPIAVTSDSNATTKTVSVLTDESGNIKGSTNDALVKINGIKVSKNTAKVKVDKLKVYDPGNNDTELAKQISSALGAEVITSIPDGETAPEGADVVVFESLN